MGTVISLDEDLVKEARLQARVWHRSVPMQIEHWARIGHIAEDNPDLSYAQIMDVLQGMHDMEEGNVKEYKRGKL